MVEHVADKLAATFQRHGSAGRGYPIPGGIRAGTGGASTPPGAAGRSWTMDDPTDVPPWRQIVAAARLWAVGVDLAQRTDGPNGRGAGYGSGVLEAVSARQTATLAVARARAGRTLAALIAAAEAQGVTSPTGLHPVMDDPAAVAAWDRGADVVARRWHLRPALRADAPVRALLDPRVDARLWLCPAELDARHRRRRDDCPVIALDTPIDPERLALAEALFDGTPAGVAAAFEGSGMLVGRLRR